MFFRHTLTKALCGCHTRLTQKYGNSNKFILNCYSTVTKEQKVNVGEQVINYLKVGTGQHHLLLLPGALGSIWTDFKPQVEGGLSQSKYTIIAWDPPGYGHSQPPPRDFPPDFFFRDATCAAKLMEVLNINKYSLLGWSDGGITALIMAGKYPQNVNKLIVWGANAFISAEDAEIYKGIRDVSAMSERYRKPMEDLYGVKGFADLWAAWVDAMVRMQREQVNGDICRWLLPLIRCPTLVIHGAKDPMVPEFHPALLVSNIPGAKKYVFKDGKHNVHLRYAEDFNKLVENFLDE
ncbi:valacyclovir hydrolase [Schistocerca nitens]|uniref:valacyclovir hydrolase n=1 Tax=Schistocerca nitens TaxID=7011 RepID=UPI002118F356|nr:valacyclovir hydrolase [Schistocerca nitens]